MAFLESPRFPMRISYAMTGGPGFRTQIAESLASFEARSAAWAYPRHRWNVSSGLDGRASWVQLRAFFMVARGRLNGWRFRDWDDYTVTHDGTNERGIVTGLTTTTFQLHKRYTIGGESVDRKIQKPLAAGFELKDGSTSLTLTTDYTLDTTTGIVTTTAPRTASNLTWAGEFDVPMRFDTDEIQSAILARDSSGVVSEWADIPIIEIKP